MLKKRFIAGATCKHCNQQDVIRWCLDNSTDQEWIECVSCGYREDKPEAIMAAEHPHTEPDSVVKVVKFKSV